MERLCRRFKNSKLKIENYKFMRLIVGLGNPGKQYEKTRHNAGFMVLDSLAEQLGGKYCATSRWSGETFEASVHGEKVIFVKPQTFMNNSGDCVVRFAAYYKLEPKDIWVISDDIDLPLGKIRIRNGGSSGGHNGLKSIDQQLGSEQYLHIRMGVGNSLDRPEPDASIFVLNPFDVVDTQLKDKAINKVAELIMDGLKTGTIESHTITVD